MIIETEDDVTPAVLAAMEGAPSARVREIAAAFVKHMHAFAREVKLTEKEWEYGIDFLNRIGKKTSDVHNEAVLFSDTIGLSTLVCLMNNGQSGSTETAAALLGPFWRMHSPKTAPGGSILRSPTPGPALFASLRVVDPSGKPVADAEVDVWHASPTGMYENQDEKQADHNLRGKFFTDADGRFSFRSVLPAGYPIPTDGPAGEMVLFQKREPWRPAHLHFLIYKPGFKTLITQVFVAGAKYLDCDVVFGVTRALVGDYKRHDAGQPPAADVQAPWYTLDYTFHVEPGEAGLPQPPIK
jgi:catechol 1,2-dioxygenase